MLLTALDFVAILVLFGQVDALGDWTASEVALLYGISTVSFALTDLAIGQLDQLPRMIREGEFDQILIRPLGTLGQVVTADVALRHLGRLTQGSVVLVVALTQVDVDWTAGAGRVAGRVDRRRLADLRGRVGRVRDDLVLADRLLRGDQLLHVRRERHGQLPDQHLRRVAAAARDLRDPDCLRLVLPRALPAGQGRPAGAARWRSSSRRPLVAVAAVLAGGLLWRFAVRRYRSVGA